MNTMDKTKLSPTAFHQNTDVPYQVECPSSPAIVNQQNVTSYFGFKVETDDALSKEPGDA
jgi:hypothetical protein